MPQNNNSILNGIDLTALKPVNRTAEESSFEGSTSGTSVISQLDFDKFTRKLGSSYNPGAKGEEQTVKDYNDKVNQERIDEIENQSGWEQAGNALGRIVGNGLLTVVENVGYLGDVLEWTGIADEDDAAYTNWLSELAKSGKEGINEALPFHMHNPGESWNVGESGWWWQSVASLGESAVGYGLTGFGAGAALRGTAGALNMGKKASDLTSTLGGAFAMNYAESKMMSVELYKNAYRDALAHYSKNYSKDEAHEMAKKVAAEEANNFIWSNKINVLSDYLQFKSLFSGRAYTRNIEDVNKGFPSVIAGYAKEGAKEGFEEISSGFLQSEGEYRAKVKSGQDVSDYEKTFLSRAAKYATSGRGLEEFVFGVAGGPIQQAIINKPIEAMYGDNDYKNQQIATQEGIINKNMTSLVNSLNAFGKREQAKQEALRKGDQAVYEQMSDEDFVDLALKNFEAGTTQDLDDKLSQVSSMAPEQAKEQGLDENYVTRASAYKNKLKSLENAYTKEIGKLKQDEDPSLAKASFKVKVLRDFAKDNLIDLKRQIRAKEASIENELSILNNRAVSITENEIPFIDIHLKNYPKLKGMTVEGDAQIDAEIAKLKERKAALQEEYKAAKTTIDAAKYKQLSAFEELEDLKSQELLVDKAFGYYSKIYNDLQNKKVRENITEQINQARNEEVAKKEKEGEEELVKKKKAEAAEVKLKDKEASNKWNDQIANAETKDELLAIRSMAEANGELTPTIKSALDLREKHLMNKLANDLSQMAQDNPVELDESLEQSEVLDGIEEVQQPVITDTDKLQIAEEEIRPKPNQLGDGEQYGEEEKGEIVVEELNTEDEQLLNSIPIIRNNKLVMSHNMLAYGFSRDYIELGEFTATISDEFSNEVSNTSLLIPNVYKAGDKLNIKIIPASEYKPFIVKGNPLKLTDENGKVLETIPVGTSVTYDMLAKYEHRFIPIGLYNNNGDLLGYMHGLNYINESRVVEANLKDDRAALNAQRQLIYSTPNSSIQVVITGRTGGYFMRISQPNPEFKGKKVKKVNESLPAVKVAIATGYNTLNTDAVNTAEVINKKDFNIGSVYAIIPTNEGDIAAKVHTMPLNSNPQYIDTIVIVTTAFFSQNRNNYQTKILEQMGINNMNTYKAFIESLLYSKDLNSVIKDNNIIREEGAKTDRHYIQVTEVGITFGWSGSKAYNINPNIKFVGDDLTKALTKVLNNSFVSISVDKLGKYKNNPYKIKVIENNEVKEIEFKNYEDFIKQHTITNLTSLPLSYTDKEGNTKAGYAYMDNPLLQFGPIESTIKEIKPAAEQLNVVENQSKQVSSKKRKKDMFDESVGIQSLPAEWSKIKDKDNTMTPEIWASLSIDEQNRIIHCL